MPERGGIGVRAGQEWPERWDLLQRYRLIEVIAQWEGRLTTGHLLRAFGIGRQQASRDINDYNTKKNPGALVYDRSLKGYKPSPSFSPHFTSGEAADYLQALSTLDGLSNSISTLEIRLPNTQVITPPTRVIHPVILQRLLRASRERLRLGIEYMSLTNPLPARRVIQPHTLVYNGYRWHARAWCEKNSQFRDFVLTRMCGEPELLNAATESTDRDVAWQTMVELEIVADDRLSQAQQRVVESDWGMTNGALHVSTRAALTTYCLQLLRLDHKTLKPNPSEQQVVLKNMDALQKWLF
jgi:predicted DNA-binding transcriptional regulator YafY